MLLKEKGEPVSNETELASIMKKFSSLLRKSLHLKKDQGGSSIILNNVLEKFILTRVLIRLEKLTKAIKSFLSNK